MAKDRQPYPWEKEYEILENLGRGGNAQVFMVKDRKEGARYALKQLSWLNRAEPRSRFQGEIRVMSQNCGDIPGILPVLRFDEEACWYTMPVAKPAMAWIKETAASPREIVQGVMDLADTLTLLHRRDISHRDIKPANLYFYENRYCLGDFGLVSFPDNANGFTRADRGLGAIFTIAPEMKRDPKHADGKKADVFSLAKTLWMLLTGDERGFDGVYQPFDASCGLRRRKSLSREHLVELEELLADATGNDPFSRPDMAEFRRRLEVWLETAADFDRAQSSEWRFINRYLFGELPPSSAVWRDRKSIAQVLNAVGSLRAFNHMLLPDGGGLDFLAALPAAEEGCLCITCAPGIPAIVKPQALYMESFPADCVWNYFLLELSSLEPVLDSSMLWGETLVEDTPGHYVPSEDSVYGVYSYETGQPLPENARTVRRYTGGSFLILLKGSPYNGVPGTYDGRHAQFATAEAFQVYMKYMRAFFRAAAAQGLSEEQILQSWIMNRNPFEEDPLEEDPPPPPKEEGRPPDDYIAQNYLTWQFTGLPETPSPGKIAFSLSFQLENGGSFASLLFRREVLLCRDGFIRENPPEDTVFSLSGREEALQIQEDCRRQLLRRCQEAGFDPPGLGMAEFTLRLRKSGNPEHLFTKEEIETLMRSADDRRPNTLVIDENGFPHLLQDHARALLYPVRHESWDPRGNYVGKYSSLSTLDETYLVCLQRWLRYLETGKAQYADYPLPEYPDAAALRELIAARCDQEAQNA